MPNRFLIDVLKGFFSLVLKFDGRNTSNRAEDVNGILLLNTTGMGDTLLSTPAIRAVREAFPDARISSLVSPMAKEILLNNPYIDRLIDYPGRVNLPFLFRLPWILKDIRKNKIDLSIVLDSNDPEAASFSYLSGAATRVGWQESKLSFLFTIPVSKKPGGVHIIDRKLKALETLGIKTQERKPDIFLKENEEVLAEELLKSEGLLNERLVGIHPFGAKKNKWWPAAYAGSLSNYLFKKYGFRIVIFGGKKERAFAQEMARDIKNKTLILAGKIGIREAASLIKRCSLFITSDSGPMHLAQSVGTPTIALFGSTDPKSAGPTGKMNLVLQKKIDCSPCKDYDCPHVSCMKAIRVEDVLNAVEEIKIRGWVS